MLHALMTEAEHLAPPTLHLDPLESSPPIGRICRGDTRDTRAPGRPSCPRCLSRRSLHVPSLSCQQYAKALVRGWSGVFGFRSGGRSPSHA